MMGTMMRLIVVAALAFLAAPAYSGSAMQIFDCHQDDDATDEQVDAIASEWLKAARGMPGGDQMEAYVRFPIAAKVGEGDFVFVVVVPTFAAWGAFTDAYEGSPAQDVDEKFNEVADCPESTIWESFEVK